MCFFKPFLVFFFEKGSWKTLASFDKKNYLYIIKGKIVESQGRARLVDDETPGLHLGRQRSCCICSSIGKGIAGTNLPKKNLPKIWNNYSELSKGSLLGPKANHSEKQCGRVENHQNLWGVCFETNHMLGVLPQDWKNKLSSWRLIGWVPFIKYIYIYMDYIYTGSPKTIYSMVFPKRPLF